MNKLETKQELTKQRAELDQEITHNINIATNLENRKHKKASANNIENKRMFKADIKLIKKQHKLSLKKIEKELHEVAIATINYEKAKKEEQ